MEKTLIYSNASDNKKRISTGKFKEVDNIVYDWVVKARNSNKPVPGYAIMEKATITAKNLKLENFSASRGWLSGFKERFGLKFKKLHGEAASVDNSCIDEWIKNNSSIIKLYKNQDIINIDETALFYNQTTQSSYVLKNEKNVRGKKQLKNRITVLVSASLSGEKLPLNVIGKFKNPRCFKNIKNLCIDYYSQQNSWMSSDIFYQIMKKMNNQFKNQNRKVLILLDQSPAHPKLLSCFENITFLFLPKNTTSVMQPLDLGIIHSLKCHYRNILCQHILAYNENNNFKYSIYDCIKTLEKAWNKVSSTTIINCFKKSKIFNEGKFHNLMV